MTKLHSSHNYESSKLSSMWTASASLNSSGPSSETNRIRMPKARAVKSSGTRSQSHLSTASHEQSRMSWRQPCYCLTCLNLLTPRRGAFRDEVQTLLQVAAAQQAESSASRRRGAATEKRVEPARNEREVSVHRGPPPRGRKTVPIQEHLIDNQRRHDARHDINEYRRRRHGDAEERGYSAHHGGRYDSDED